MTTPKPVGLHYLAGTPLNPGNVPNPRNVDVRRIWDIDEPITDKQTNRIFQLLDRAGITEKELGGFLGDGFTDVVSMSKWAASWCISELSAFLMETDEAAMKRHMARVLREAYPNVERTYGGTDD